MGKWDIVKLGDVCDVRDGTHDSPKYIKHGYPLVTSKNIANGYIDITDVNYISKDDYNKIIVRSGVDDGDIIMPMIGTIGNPIVVLKKFDFAIKNVALVKFVGNNVFNRYVFYILSSIIFKRYIERENRGGTQKFISLGNIRNFKIPLPPLEIQKQIAKTLNTSAELLVMRKRHLAELDSLIKSTFYDIFGDPVTNPFNWKTQQIGNCCTLKSGTTLPTEVENEGGDVPYVKVGDMNLQGNEKYITTSSRFVTYKTAGKGLFNIGTVIFPKRGGAIGTNKKRLTSSRICADLNIMGVTPTEIINSEYLLSFFDTIDLGKLNNGSSVPQINNKDIAPLLLPIPPIKQQNKFAEIVTKVEEQKTLVKKAIAETQYLFDSLMSQYFD